jgi:hypothetical protein
MIFSKILTMKIEISKMSSEQYSELEYSISGQVSEQGRWFGFSFPLAKNEFNPENISQIIERQCKPIVWGLPENIKINPKIVSDCRAKQLTLF